MFKKFFAGCLALLTIALVMFPVSAAENKTVAHWKFQNVEGYYSGNLSSSNLTFYDLTGNGNDLEVKTVGFGDKLDIFKWYDAPAVGADKEAKSSLFFGNTLKAAQSVDPYPSSETTWTGAYTSGKYFNTVPGAPMNDKTFEYGFTIEIIFCIDENFNNEYNRYTGIFSRNYILAEQQEPALQLALAECAGQNADSYLGDSGRTWLQYIQINSDGTKINNEFYSNIGLYPGDWIHYMATNNGEDTEIYINGEFIAIYPDAKGIMCVNPEYGWEVGVGRKPGEGRTDHKNENVPEGTIRRLFCGAISEIRVSEGYMDVMDSLYMKAPKYDLAPKTEQTAVTADTPTADAPATEPADTTDAPASVSAPATFDAATVVVLIAAGATACTAMFAKKRKNN